MEVVVEDKKVVQTVRESNLEEAVNSAKAQAEIDSLLIPDQEHAINQIKRENMMRKNIDGGDNQEEDEFEYMDDYVPMTEFTTVCNADFAPLICNEFISEFLDKNSEGAALERQDAIDLTRNFCSWISRHDLTCAEIQMNHGF